MAASWTEQLPYGLQPQGDGGSLVGRLTDGRRVVAKALPTASDEQAALLFEHLKRLGGYSEPHLLPVCGAALDGMVVWVLSEVDDGTPLRTLLERSRLSTAQAAEVGIEVLSGLAALQRAGLGHGALHTGNVHVGRDGRMRLGDYALRPRFRPGGRLIWQDPRADVIAAGALLCTALDVSATPEPGELSEPERVAPALVTTARALAGARGGRSAAAALAAVRSGAGGLAEPALLQRSARELAVLAGGEPAPPVAEEAPPAAARPVEGPPPGPLAGPPPRHALRWASALLLSGLAVGVAAFGIAHRASPTATPPNHVAAGAPAASPTAPPTSQPQPRATEAAPTSAPAQPASAPGGTPDGTVASFYRLIGQHDFDTAVQLWSPRMQASYPPPENIDQRFSDTTTLRLERDQVVWEAGGRAVVSIDLVEVRGGRAYRWVGNWYLVETSSRWLLDQPSLRPA